MTVDEFLHKIRSKSPPAPLDKLEAFEALIGTRLPEDYRDFLIRCNGGYTGGRCAYQGPTADAVDDTVSIHHIDGFRTESHFSLEWSYQVLKGRLPGSLVGIMDDPGGNAICLGITGKHRGRVYFWDHEEEPDEEEWDGEVESAGNVTLIANSFMEFVAGIVG